MIFKSHPSRRKSFEPSDSSTFVLAPNEGFQSRSVSVPPEKVPEVRSMLASGCSISEILAFLGRVHNTSE